MVRIEYVCLTCGCVELFILIVDGVPFVKCVLMFIRVVRLCFCIFVTVLNHVYDLSVRSCR